RPANSSGKACRGRASECRGANGSNECEPFGERCGRCTTNEQQRKNKRELLVQQKKLFGRRLAIRTCIKVSRDLTRAFCSQFASLVALQLVTGLATGLFVQLHVDVLLDPGRL